MPSLYPANTTLHKKERPRVSPLPSFAHDKPPRSFEGHARRWSTPINIPANPFSRKSVTIHLPIPPNVYRVLSSRRIVQFVLLGLALLSFLSLRKRGNETPPPPTESHTLVFPRVELQRIWQWEIQAGHYPSTRDIPEAIQLNVEYSNPGLPLQQDALKALREGRRPNKPKTGDTLNVVTRTIGAGPERSYINLRRDPRNREYPPRPGPYSIADLDMIMYYCEFPQNFVRDCLEVLRIATGLDSSNVRLASTEHWNYLFKELIAPNYLYPSPQSHTLRGSVKSVIDNDGLNFKAAALLEEPLKLTDPAPTVFRPTPAQPCDPNYPRIFHMFWTGPFTDKPYMSILSFLYSQNVGLNSRQGEEDSSVCRPQFWMWIKPGSAAAETQSNAFAKMFDSLASNPWSAPFLHDRFKDILKFKLWSTTEQLDGIQEIKHHWRNYTDSLFNAGGHVYSVPKRGSTSTSKTSVEDSLADMVTTDGVEKQEFTSSSAEDDMFTRVGSQSSDTYDRLSVILSDMARFVLCHRFGGVYLDADTLLLRDWEELWGWKGSFAYRWSRLPSYNTAILRLNKGSALGSFLFRTALRNGLDFHPMSVSNYLKEAHLEELLLMLPDALFDPAWLNTEYFQLDRPPFPYFSSFTDFFATPPGQAAAPQAVGLEGFFRGAYAYHWHNQWWEKFDPVRNYPELGPVFSKLTSKPDSTTDDPEDTDWVETVEQDDKRDLSWATVTKRTFEAWVRGDRPNLYGEWFAL